MLLVKYKSVKSYYHNNILLQETYNTFDYTSLLYLTDYGTDFEGGRFVFTDKDANRTVEPKLGMVLIGNVSFIMS